ncbi:hypothetical protein [Alkalibacillus silvisoli]|uniref:Type II secretion system protein n=1 Tax=Alkalibacillus silvisoli TaxID=392823 RepID=A0ABN0ZSU9_9BACI
MLLKHEDGFVLQDALLSLSCFIIMMSVLFPFIVHLYEYKTDIELRQNAYHLLHQQTEQVVTEKISNSKESDHYNDYNIEIEEKNKQIVVCISWVNTNETEEKLCRHIPSR